MRWWVELPIWAWATSWRRLKPATPKTKIKKAMDVFLIALFSITFILRQVQNECSVVAPFMGLPDKSGNYFTWRSLKAATPISGPTSKIIETSKFGVPPAATDPISLEHPPREETCPPPPSISPKIEGSGP